MIPLWLSALRTASEDPRFHRVLFTTETTGVLYPMDQIPETEKRLSGFFWAEQERPMSPMDVLQPTRRLERPTTAIKSAVDNVEEDEATIERRRSRREKAKNRNVVKSER